MYFDFFTLFVCKSSTNCFPQLFFFVFKLKMHCSDQANDIIWPFFRYSGMCVVFSFLFFASADLKDGFLTIEAPSFSWSFKNVYQSTLLAKKMIYCFEVILSLKNILWSSPCRQTISSTCQNSRFHLDPEIYPALQHTHFWQHGLEFAVTFEQRMCRASTGVVG